MNRASSPSSTAASHVPRITLNHAGQAGLKDLLLIVSISCAVFAMSPQFTVGTWLVEPILAMLGLTALLTMLRGRGWSDVIAVSAGLGASLLYFLVRFSGAEGQLRLPTPSAVEGFIQNLQTAGQHLALASPPAEVTWPVRAILCAGFLMLFILADCLAIGLRWPIIGAALPILLWIPGIALEAPGPFWPVLPVTAIALIMLYQPQLETAADSRPASNRTTALIVALTMTVSFLATPLMAALPGWRLAFETSNPFSNSLSTVTLSEVLSMDRDLGRQSGRTVFTYVTSDPDAVTRFRMFSSHEFNGAQWERSALSDSPSQQIAFQSGQLLWPTLAQVPAPYHRLTLTMGELGTQDVPLPTVPRIVHSALPGLAYNMYEDVLYSPSGMLPRDAELSYEVSVDNFTAEQLRTSGYQTLPTRIYQTPFYDEYEAEIHELASVITRGARTHYDAALAIQEYLRTSPHFTYSTSIGPAVTSSPVWDFLNDGRGYCVQFATAMVVMLRSLDIPTRMAVGFLSGEADDSGVYSVTGTEAHTWPEVYFDDIGWVAFEPTPAVHTGEAPQWAQPGNASTATPTPTPSPTATNELPSAPTAGPTTAPTHSGPSSTSGTGSGQSSTDSNPDVIAVVMWSVLALLLVIGVVATIRRRRFRARYVHGHNVEEIYDDLRTKFSQVGVTWPDSASLEQIAAAIRNSVVRGDMIDVAAVRGESSAPEGIVAANIREDFNDLVAQWVRTVELSRYSAADSTSAAESRDLANRVWLAARPAAEHNKHLHLE